MADPPFLKEVADQIGCLPSIWDRALKRCKKDESGCVIWTGPVSGYGYGSIGYGHASKIYLHRLSHVLFNGPIPEGFQVDHLCRVRNCINPEHLEAVSRRENLLRSECASGRNAKKTHCPRGHPLVDGNLRRVAVGRACLTCHRASAHRSNARAAGNREPSWDEAISRVLEKDTTLLSLLKGECIND